MSTQTTGYNIQGNVLAQQPDGKILTAGSLNVSQSVNQATGLLQFASNLAIARYLPDGTPDPSFGQNGVVVTDLDLTGSVNVYVQSDGKILVVAGTDYGISLLRLNPDGTPDTSFGPANTGSSIRPCLLSQRHRSPGRQHPGGGLNASAFFVSRYTATGTPDPTFGPPMNRNRAVATELWPRWTR